MEQVLNAIKAFIAAHPTAFTSLATTGVPMTAPAAKDIVIGPVDLSRYEGNIVVSLIGETEEDERDALAEVTTSHSVVVTFLCRGYESETLVKQSCRYAVGLRNLIISDGTADGAVDDILLGERRFFPDCGAVEKQMAAVEVNISVRTVMTI